jgi:hypothetical protein
MNKNLVAYAALGLSALACILFAVTWSRSDATHERGVEAAGPDPAQLDQLAERTEKLRAEVARLTDLVHQGGGLATPIDRAPVRAELPQELLDRLAALEKAVTALQQQADERAAKLKNEKAAPPDLTSALRAATDPRSSELDKLAALKLLRNQQIDGQDARTHDVVLSMIDLAERSLDESTRDAVYRDLHGVDDASLRDSMVRALANDPSAKVRQRAARDINTFLSDAGVVRALQRAADNDADAHVRAQEATTLASER